MVVEGFNISAQLSGAIEAEAVKINQLLNKYLAGSPEGLYASANYLPSLGGKRLRPFVTITCGKMLGATDEPLYLSALGVELLHNFTLIHDDIIDRDDYRRGNLTVHKIYGEAIAILAGDLLFAKAFEAASLAERLSGTDGIVEKLVYAAIKLDEGQFLDVSFENKEDVGIEQYLEMVTLKTGVLYEASAVIGGLVSRVTLNGDREIAALAEYGKNLGLCFQIRDDYLGIFGDPKKTGKSVGNDIKRGKRTAVTILASKFADEKTLNLMRAISRQDKVDDSLLVDVVEGLKKVGVDSKCMDLASSFGLKALDSLSNFPDNPQRKLLAELVNYAWKRDR
ncbi:MAG: polyprenyl synthetase family protein [Thermoprotei archaeon]